MTASSHAYDPDLEELFRGAREDELAVLAQGLEQQIAGFVAPRELSSAASRRALHDEALRAGSRPLGNLFAGPTARWDPLVRAVAGRLKLEPEFVPVEDLEQQIATTLIVRCFRGLEPETRAAAERDLLSPQPESTRARLQMVLEGTAEPSESTFAALATALLRAPPDAATLDPIVERLERWLRGRKLRAVALTTFMKLLGLGTGPLGMSLSVMMLGKKLAGPTYELIVPMIVWAAIVRERITRAREPGSGAT